MASAEEDNVGQEVSGRRTRSGRKVSAHHALGSTTRATRRSSRKHVEEQLAENDAPDIIPEEQNLYCFEDANEQQTNSQPSSDGNSQSDIIREMFAVGTQSVTLDSGPECETNESTVEEVMEERLQDECVYYEEIHMPEEEQIEEDVEMYNLPEDDHNDTIEVPVASVSETGVDEKSSSFPFGTVGQSETSDDVHNEEEDASEEIIGTGAVESSLLASLAGDNANSLPSVGCVEESESNKKEDFEVKAVESIQPNCESLDSDDSLSNPAIAEDVGGGGGGAADASDATIVNMEMVSEDELPLPVKPEINDAEEVSDDELPAPQRAELPADAEVISEDELPAASANDKKSPCSSPNRDQISHLPDTANTDSCGGQKRKADGSNNAPQTASEGKKKSNNEQYNPMSPTSESNDGLPPPPEKKAKVDGADTEQQEKKRDKEKERKRLPDLDKYWRTVKDDPADFTGWTYLLQYVDNETDAEAAREAYDAFLEYYPYCYGYWRKYADFEKRKGIKSNCNAVFERGLEAIPLSVDLWIHYLTHVKSTLGDNEDYIRSQFERAISACGLEFRSDKLWDAYIKWENDGKRYDRMRTIYDRLLTIPTQGYSGHFDNFQDLINQHSLISTISSEELIKTRYELHESVVSRLVAASRSSKNRGESNLNERGPHDEKTDDQLQSEKLPASTEIVGATEAPGGAACDIAKPYESVDDGDLDDLSTVTVEEIAAIKDKILSVRRKWHKNTVNAVTIRWTFEEAIKRPYFHVKPLERSQLKNWKDYLDFEIELGDRKRILVLFERCLIACALYDEFWLKMIRYLETQLVDKDAQPGSMIADITSDVFRRACHIHHPDKPSLHLMWSAFEECMGQFDRAAEILVKLEKKCPNILQVAYRRINVERRRGDLSKCRELYEHYINAAKNKTIAGSLSIKYARLLNKQCNDLDGGLCVLREALDRDGANTRVALQMIDLALQRPKVDEEEVVMIMDRFMSRENIDPDQKVLFAQRKVEFLEDFGGTAKGLQNAQRFLQLALCKANEAKKKREPSPNRKSGSVKDSCAMSGASAQSGYNNGGSTAANPYYSSSNPAYAAYGQTAGGAYQQQQQPYDGYYNHWQYGSTGYNGYGQWSGYGNYY